MKQESYDVVVIGSGIGGMCAAALLARSGYKTLVVESLPHIGGRCSTMEYKGFHMSTGPHVIHVEGPIGQVFEEAGAKMEVRTLPPPTTRYRIRGEDFEMPVKGGLRAVVAAAAQDEAEVDRVMGAVRHALVWEEPSDAISLYEWLSQYTHNEALLGIFEGLVVTVDAINSWELPAGEFIRYLKTMAGVGGWSYPPQGFLKGIMQPLADVVTAGGGQVWTRSRAQSILIEGNRATGAVVRKGDQDIAVAARAVISTAGPKNTVALGGAGNFDKAHLQQLAETPGNVSGIALTIVSDRPLIPYKGLLMFTQSRRVKVVFPITNHCPEIAPEGKHLLESHGAALSGMAPFNFKKEVDLNIQDLRDNLPGFDDAEIFMARCWRKGWPGYWTWSGYNLPQRTSVENLWNVGDGVMPSGWIGLPGCARSAQIVASDIKKRLPLEAR